MNTGQDNKSALKVTATVWLIALAGLHLYAGITGDGRLWGFDSWAGYSTATDIVLFVFGLLLIVPPLTSMVARGVDRLAHLTGKIPERISLTILISIAAVAFWKYSAATGLLGDGDLLSKSVDQGDFFKKSSPLALHLVLLVKRALGWLGTGDGRLAFRIVSLVSGILYTFFGWQLAKLMGRRWRSRALIFCGLVSLGLMQLFFGYIEVYPPVCAFLLGYLYFTLRLIETNKGAAASASFFYLSVFAHVTTLILLPSIVYAHYLHWRDRGINTLLKAVLPVYLAPLLAVVALAYLAGLDLTGIVRDEARTRLAFHLLVSPGDPMYLFPFFGIDYFRSLFNLITLIVPLWPLLACALFISGFVSSASGRFLALASVCTLALTVSFSPELGYPRDWDVFAFTLIAPSLLGLISLARSGIGGEASQGRLLVAIVGAGILYTGTWVQQNHSRTDSFERMERVLAGETGLSTNARLNTHETLAISYRDQGELEQALAQYEQMTGLAPDAPRYLINEAAIEIALEKYADAEQTLTRALDLAPESFEAAYLRGVTRIRQGKLRQALADLDRALELNPDLAPAYGIRADVNFKLGNFARAESDYTVMLEQDSADPNALANRGYSRLMTGDFRGAIDDFQRAIAIQPESPDILFNLGVGYARLGDNERAMDYIRQAAELGSVQAREFLHGNNDN